ncbi:MAG: VOC family protein [Anaerolineales bacterium]
MIRTLFPILYARDLPQALRFYRDLLGMSESYRFPDTGDPVFVTLRWGEAELGLGTYDPVEGLEGRKLKPPVDGRGFELCLYVEDVDATVLRLQHAGTPILIAPVNQPWGERLAYVEDPEGNAVMLTAKVERTVDAEQALAADAQIPSRS